MWRLGNPAVSLMRKWARLKFFLSGTCGVDRFWTLQGRNGRRGDYLDVLWHSWGTARVGALLWAEAESLLDTGSLIMCKWSYVSLDLMCCLSCRLHVCLPVAAGLWVVSLLWVVENLCKPIWRYSQMDLLNLLNQVCVLRKVKPFLYDWTPVSPSDSSST